MTKSLWGDLPETGTVRTPAIILQEQAQLLTEETSRLLVGRVEPLEDHGRRLAARRGIERVAGLRTFDLRVTAPVLSYEIQILSMAQQEAGYPVFVWTPDGEGFVTCDNEAEFADHLAEILTSNRVRSVITALLAESQQLGPREWTT